MVTRITGMASGLDVDSLVKQLMKAKQATLDNMVRKRTKLEWQQEDYRTMAAKIVDFRNNKVSNYNLSTAINAKSTTVSGDQSAVTVNSTSSSASGSLNVKVESVAEFATKVFTFAGANDTTELGDLLESDGTNVTVTINGEPITLSKTSKLSDLATAINAKSGTTKSTALYKDGQLSISATQTGVGANTVDSNGNTVKTGTLDIQMIDVNSIGINGVEAAKGGQAKVIINGITYESDSNKFSVNGYTFTVNAKTATGSSTTLTATRDVDKIVETVKSFISDYNSLISAVNSELSEQKYYKYNPLTSDEKEGMTDDEIKLWQDKARSGTLQNDSTLKKMISDFRFEMTSLVAGIKDANGQSISIGITTGSYSEQGKLYLDESKLRTALESNPDEVVNLFSGQSSGSSSGLFSKVLDTTMEALKSLQTKAGTSLYSTDLNTTLLANSLLSTQISEMKKQEDFEQERLNNAETQYYKMFTAMETAINRYNSQSSSISSMLG
ncbi:flagellar filament capping protein FliD [Cohnella sp. AR92]|uniref:flagellar filament capping protein FliD n=1 Tax=Cohnella sp. AR92 TaxID=648716 RepID=UPI000F8E3E8B|nr:flagellar filament capping protein FliD [Cohnella sp. AR92]RUS43046.1 hypothetical protein ELR57_25405 [Cohnella sp. AR92]